MSDQQIWFSRIGQGIEVRAAIQRLHAHQDSGRLFSGELRITIGDELVLSELFCDERKLNARSMQIFELVTGMFQMALL